MQKLMFSLSQRLHGIHHPVSENMIHLCCWTHHFSKHIKVMFEQNTVMGSLSVYGDFPAFMEFHLYLNHKEKSWYDKVYQLVVGSQVIFFLDASVIDSSFTDHQIFQFFLVVMGPCILNVQYIWSHLVFKINYNTFISLMVCRGKKKKPYDPSLNNYWRIDKVQITSIFLKTS